MFFKNDLKLVYVFEKGIFHTSFLVQYNLFEDNETEKKERIFLYNKLKDSALKEFIIKPLFKKIKTPIYFLIRVTDKREIAKKYLINLLKEEYKIREKIRHNFLINFIDSFQDKKKLFYLTEFPLNGFFYFYLRKKNILTKNESIFFIAEIILAIQYLHSKKLIYRKLIPNNIFLSKDGHIKLNFDFLNKDGLEDEMIEPNLEYISFDYLKYQEIGFESDYWSIGIILYEMLIGKSPFKGKEPRETEYNILCQEIEYPNFIDYKTKDLINLLLDRDRKKRYEMFCSYDFNFVKKHPFFEDLNWNFLENKKIRSPYYSLHFFDIPENLRNFSDFFTDDYRKGETDGYQDTFKYYKKGKFNKSKKW